MLRAGDFRILQCRRETSGVVTNCLVVRIGFKCGCARQHGAVKVVLRDVIVTYHSWEMLGQSKSSGQFGRAGERLE